MKKILITLIITFLAVVISGVSYAAIKGCKSSCTGIPKGKCSCVSIEGYTCCGLRTDALTSAVGKPAKVPAIGLRAKSKGVTRVKGCKSSCTGIPKGKCSCVSIEGYTCCGLRADTLTVKPRN